MRTRILASFVRSFVRFVAPIYLTATCLADRAIVFQWVIMFGRLGRSVGRFLGPGLGLLEQLGPGQGTERTREEEADGQTMANKTDVRIIAFAVAPKTFNVKKSADAFLIRFGLSSSINP